MSFIEKGDWSLKGARILTYIYIMHIYAGNDTKKNLEHSPPSETMRFSLKSCRVPETPRTESKFCAC